MSTIQGHPRSARETTSAPARSHRPGTHAMAWLVRYARHCGHSVEHEGTPIETRLRELFGAAAWRVLCRSGRKAFLPILRNRELDIDSLVQYCRELALRSFVRAPRPELLAYFIIQRRLYFTERCKVPRDVDYLLMRIADREPAVRIVDVALVCDWLDSGRKAVDPRVRWATLVRRARHAAEQEAARLRHARHRPWHFYCRDIAWRGLRITPLVDPLALWNEGTAMANCLYKLRGLCDGRSYSRFFGIMRSGKRVATLEMCLDAPRRGFYGMDRELGRWRVRDLRLAFNAVPDAALAASMRDFAAMYNEWAKRPGRWQPGYRGKVGCEAAVLERPAATNSPAVATAPAVSRAAAAAQTPARIQAPVGTRRMTLTREEMEAAARARGFGIAGPDHPVYREGPTIHFSSGSSAQPGPKVIDLPYS